MRVVKRKTRRQYDAEEKIRVALDGLRGEMSIAESFRREYLANQKNFYVRISHARDQAAIKDLTENDANSEPQIPSEIFKSLDEEVQKHLDQKQRGEREL